MTQTTTKSLLDTALDAAFPALPAGMTMEEARRRIAAALAAVDWRIREEAAAGVLRGVSERIWEYGRSTADPQTARAYERAALDEL